MTEGLSYCNRCGAEVGEKNRTVPLKPAPIPEFLVWAIVGVSVGGLAIIVGLIAVMKWAGFNNELIALFSMLSFLLLLGAESVFIWLMLRSRSAAKEPSVLSQSREFPTQELGEKQARALPEPVPSVTEQTTRTLEPVYRERKPE
ncbi:MAG: hypothetical protein ND895_12190 [Pyrinomonadaceae bacterium]|nr:hypothetical protein [Pyrinomonadaceae bacterium]